VALYQPIVKGETVQKLDVSYLRPQWRLRFGSDCRI
jgi:hypothetical protein